MDPELEQKLKALDAFKDWTNYLLVTTVAALGWTAGKDPTTFTTPCMRTFAVLAFAISIVFAILALALVPHVAEDLQKSAGGTTYPSIYRVHWEHWWVKVRLTNLCLPQHVLFLVGIILYAVGTTFKPPTSWCIFWSTLIGLVAVILLFSNLSRIFR